jgi:hypothetical protein
MQIGDLLTHDGRRYLLRGFDPQSVIPRLAYVEDVETREQSALLFEEVSLPSTRRGGMRLVRPDNEELHKDLL